MFIYVAELGRKIISKYVPVRGVAAR